MKTFGRFIMLVAAAMAAMSANAVLAESIAFITDVKGEAALAGGKASIMAEVGKGARIVCVKECRVGVMYLASGIEFTLMGPGDFVVGETDVAAKIGAPPTVRETSWKVSAQTVNQAVQTSNASIRMRSVGSASSLKAEDALPTERLLYPVQTAVATLQPVFRWTAVKPRGPFDFELKTAGATAKMVYKARSADTAIKLPARIKLQPGAEYTWTVRMTGTEIGAGAFHTLPASSLDVAQKGKPGDKAEFSDWLLYALTLKEMGAGQDAAEVFGKLAKQRPDVPELAALAK